MEFSARRPQPCPVAHAPVIPAVRAQDDERCSRDAGAGEYGTAFESRGKVSAREVCAESLCGGAAFGVKCRLTRFAFFGHVCISEPEAIRGSLQKVRSHVAVAIWTGSRQIMFLSLV